MFTYVQLATRGFVVSRASVPEFLVPKNISGYALIWTLPHGFCSKTQKCSLQTIRFFKCATNSISCTTHAMAAAPDSKFAGRGFESLPSVFDPCVFSDSSCTLIEARRDVLISECRFSGEICFGALRSPLMPFKDRLAGAYPLAPPE